MIITLINGVGIDSVHRVSVSSPQRGKVEQR